MGQNIELPVTININKWASSLFVLEANSLVLILDYVVEDSVVDTGLWIEPWD